MPNSRYRILIVDDIEDNVFMLSALLEAEGYSVDAAYSGYSALKQIQASPPDLILLDITMPDLDGYEVTRRIREELRLNHIPILLVTAHVEPKAAEGLRLGANDFIRKPIDFDEVLARVEAFLRFKEDVQRTA